MLSLPSPLNLSLRLTDEQFWQLCQQHRDLKFERSATGELIIMSPTGGLTSNRNSGIVAQLYGWNRQTKLGKVFDSSGGFTLPNGSDRSPDAAWVTLARWNALTPEQQERFLPLCPDFVVELRSPSDALPTLQAKMREYQENGAKLGLLLDPQRQVVEIYCPGQEPECLTAPSSVDCGETLPGFILQLDEIF